MASLWRLQNRVPIKIIVSLAPDGRAMLSRAARWHARGDAMLKPHACLSGCCRSGRRRPARRCGAGGGVTGSGCGFVHARCTRRRRSNSSHSTVFGMQGRSSRAPPVRQNEFWRTWESERARACESIGQGGLSLLDVVSASYKHVHLITSPCMPDWFLVDNVAPP